MPWRPSLKGKPFFPGLPRMGSGILWSSDRTGNVSGGTKELGYVCLPEDLLRSLHAQPRPPASFSIPRCVHCPLHPLKQPTCCLSGSIVPPFLCEPMTSEESKELCSLLDGWADSLLSFLSISGIWAPKASSAEVKEASSSMGTRKTCAGSSISLIRVCLCSHL